MGLVNREVQSRQRYTKEELELVVNASNEDLSLRAIVNLLARRGFERTEPSVAYIVRKLGDSKAPTLEDFLQGNHNDD